MTALYEPALLDSAVDYRLWAMFQDGQWRNQIQDGMSMQQYSSMSEGTLKKRAEERLRAAIPGLLIGTADGASTIFDFDMVSSTISVSAL